MPMRFAWLFRSRGALTQTEPFVPSIPPKSSPGLTSRTPSKVTAAPESPAQHGPPLPTEHGLLKQLRNDTGNADRLILKFGRHLRYCPAFRKWLVWDGRRP